MTTVNRLVLSPLLVGLLACTVTDGNPDLWTPSGDLGGGALGGVAGATGSPGGGGSPGGAGGAPSGGGGAPSGGGGGLAGAGLGGSAGVPAAGGSTSSGPCSLHFEFTTLTYNGKYSPKNIGAVWIANTQGQFVKSLEVWAAKRIINLVKWNAAAQGNTVDAITSATMPGHGTHVANWDCTDVAHQIVPDGPYRVIVEFTEEDSALFIWPPGPSVEVEFVKGPNPVSFAPPNHPNFVSMTLSVD